MRKRLEKLLICILIFLLLFNFIYLHKVYAATFNDIIGGITGLAGGIVGIFTWPFRFMALAIGTGIQLLTGTVATLMGGVESDGSFLGTAASTIDSIFITPYDIFFNKLGITSINFFDVDGGGNASINTLRAAVAGWYYIIRLIAVSILLLILIYIGIRMALSTIASEKAIYKKMLVDWMASLAIVFVLHYLIIFIIKLNESIVTVMSGISNSTVGGDFVNVTLKLAWEGLQPLSGAAGIASTAVYILIIWQTFAFLITYIKRMLTIGFLIIISPLITITYSIDRIGDGKSQALDSWLKEFVYNILIQPFHCILYLVFVDVAINLVTGDGGNAFIDTISFGLSGAFSNGTLGAAILAIMCMKFVWDGEKIVRKIFGFEKAGSLASAAASAAVAASAVGKLGSAAKGAATTVRSGMNMFKGDSKLAQAFKKDLGKISERRFEKKFEKGKILGSDGKAITGEENREAARKKYNEDRAKSPIRQIVSKREKKAEEERKQAEKDEKIVKGEEPTATEDDKKAAQSRIADREKKAKQKEDRAKRKESRGKIISGIKDSETFKYYTNPKRLGVGVGIVAGLGMYSGGSTGVLQAIAGAKAGHSFGEEFFKTSTKRQRGEVDEQLQTQADITGQDVDKDKTLRSIYGHGENKQYDEKNMRETLKDFIKELEGVLGSGKGREANAIAGSIQSQLIKDPAGFSLEKAFGDGNVDFSELDEGQKKKLESSSRNYASIVNESNIYQNILRAEATGLGISGLANNNEIVSTSKPVEVKPDESSMTDFEKSVTQEVEKLMDTQNHNVEEIARRFETMIQKNTDIGELQKGIDALQRVLDRSKSSDPKIKIELEEKAEETIREVRGKFDARISQIREKEGE